MNSEALAVVDEIISAVALVVRKCVELVVKPGSFRDLEEDLFPEISDVRIEARHLVVRLATERKPRRGTAVNDEEATRSVFMYVAEARWSATRNDESNTRLVLTRRHR